MKKYLLGLFAVALAVGFSAFTAAPKNFTSYYIADEQGGQYLITTNAGESLCDEGQKLCAFTSEESLSGWQDKETIDLIAAQPEANAQFDRP